MSSPVERKGINANLLRVRALRWAVVSVNVTNGAKIPNTAAKTYVRMILEVKPAFCAWATAAEGEVNGSPLCSAGREEVDGATVAPPSRGLAVPFTVCSNGLPAEIVAEPVGGATRSRRWDRERTSA